MAVSSDTESDGSADVNSVRDAAKWLATAFAAVGAALLGGIQFSQLGALREGAFLLGIGGFLLGLAGVALAIWATSNVLVTRIVSVTALYDEPHAVGFLDSRPDIVGREYESFADFIKQRNQSWADWQADRLAGRGPERAGLSAHLAHLEEVATRVARIWRFEKICRTFTKARRF